MKWFMVQVMMASHGMACTAALAKDEEEAKRDVQRRLGEEPAFREMIEGQCGNDPRKVSEVVVVSVLGADGHQHKAYGSLKPECKCERPLVQREMTMAQRLRDVEQNLRSAMLAGGMDDGMVAWACCERTVMELADAVRSLEREVQR